MSEKILVPVLGESITEATVAKWLKNPGDTVEADEPIVELETDKVNLEVPSPISGVLTEINSQDGSVVEVGALLGFVSEKEESVKITSVRKEEIKKDDKNGLRMHFEINAVPVEKWIEKQERLNRFFVKGLESEFIMDDNKKEFDFILFY